MRWSRSFETNGIRPSDKFCYHAAMAQVARLLVVSVWILLGGTAEARPGGGQSYHSSSHPSSSHSSGGSGFSTGGHYYVPGVGGEMPGWVVILIIVAFVIVFILWRRGKSQGEDGGEVAEGGGSSPETVRELQSLSERDPSFEVTVFTDRAVQTMAKVNQAWQNGDMGPARRLISDGVFVRFQTQLKLLKAQGIRNVMADWRVISAELVGAESDSLWDTLHLRLSAEARDTDVPTTADAEHVTHAVERAERAQYTEIWSFLRRRGLKSKAGVPALEGKCPSCGADLPLSEVVQCSYCKSIINSGEHDWVMAEITQQVEWSPDSAGEVPGLIELRQRDPSVSRQELEDRASVVFWKWIEARVTNNRAPLDRFCARAGEPAIAPAPLTEVAVGSADVRSVDLGSDGRVGGNADGKDRSTVEIRWSAAQGGGEPAGTASWITLVRAVGAQSRRGLSSLDCPGCGGALSGSDAVKCAYCGEMLAGRKDEWTLDAIR